MRHPKTAGRQAGHERRRRHQGPTDTDTRRTQSGRSTEPELRKLLAAAYLRRLEKKIYELFDSPR